MMRRACVVAVMILASSAALSAGAECDRACLEGFVDRYVDAVVAHDPAQAPLARTAKFTENGQRLHPGDGLWNTASARASYGLYMADPEGQQVGFFGTIRENDNLAILALRLKVVGGEITEAETLVARTREEAERVEALGAPHPLFSAMVPPAERASREQLVEVGNLYFLAVERNDGKGVYPFTDDCNRIENGKQTTNKPAEEPRPFDIDALGCKEQFETGFFRFVTRIRDRRFFVVDPERGLALAFAFFDHAGNIPTVTLSDGRTIPIGVTRLWTWAIAEVFRIEKGLIRQVEAVFQEVPYGTNSGWSTWDEGLSEEPRVVR